MQCSRCGNRDPRYFWKDGKQIYCRKCVNFGRVDLGEPLVPYASKPRKCVCDVQLDFPLTKYQQAVIRQLNDDLREGHDVFVYAACGAGKTEIVMESIARYLKEGKRVGFAISRRQVVLEICERMRKAFPQIRVVAVCEGYTDQTDGDLIVCTMHQLYRYYRGFDLLIMDEVDAFPFRDNEMLEKIAESACVGQRIYLSATPDERDLKRVEAGELKMVELFRRPHGYPLVEPRIISAPPAVQACFLLSFIRRHQKQHKPFLLFVPTITCAAYFEKILSLFCRCRAFTSKTIEKERLVAELRAYELEFLICTTVLERGITIHGVDVVIWKSDHPVFHEASLIQMIGRVGRSITMPSGEGLFLCTRKTTAIKRCARALRKMNEEGDICVN